VKIWIYFGEFRGGFPGIAKRQRAFPYLWEERRRGDAPRRLVPSECEGTYTTRRSRRKNIYHQGTEYTEFGVFTFNNSSLRALRALRGKISLLSELCELGVSAVRCRINL
jgi:hypothetical protein